MALLSNTMFVFFGDIYVVVYIMYTGDGLITFKLLHFAVTLFDYAITVNKNLSRVKT